MTTPDPLTGDSREDIMAEHTAQSEVAHKTPAQSQGQTASPPPSEIERHDQPGKEPGAVPSQDSVPPESRNSPVQQDTSEAKTPTRATRPSIARAHSSQSTDLPDRSSRHASLSYTVDSQRRRTDSQSTTATSATTRTLPRSSMVFVTSALETIAASKDARKRKPLADAAQQALTAVKSHGDLANTNPETIFLPLQMATESSTTTIVTTALDCIGKLITYSYFVLGSEHKTNERPPLIERAIDTICDCFQGEATPVDVQMQIIKSLLAAILNDKIVVHGAGLLKAIRQIYNVFLLSKSSANQQIAQGTLAQMVGTVFARAKARLASRASRIEWSKTSLNSALPAGVPLSPDTPLSGYKDNSVPPSPRSPTVGERFEDDATEPGEDVEEGRMTLQTFETRRSFDDAKIADNAPTTVTRVTHARAAPRSVSGTSVPAITIQADGTEVADEDEEDEIYIKDAFLTFRAMCKLSTKALTVEDTVDQKSQGMRSKLLSLHIIHSILHNHSIVFSSPHATIRNGSSSDVTSFTQAVKQYLCLSLSRNGASSNNRVFEVGCEIFFLMIQHLRVSLKREIEVFLKEIYLAILDKRTAPTFQKQYIVFMLSRLMKDGKTLVEIYLNYDCDRAALDNMYQRTIEHVARIASGPVNVTSEQEYVYFEHYKSSPRTGPSDWQHKAILPQSMSTVATPANVDLEKAVPGDYLLKQEALECLIESLRSMVAWSQQGIVAAVATIPGLSDRTSLEDVRESMDTRQITTDGSTPLPSSTDNLPASTAVDTPRAEDDPIEFERVKQHKTALNDAIKQFNFKPKRGLKALIKGGFIVSDSPQDIARFMLSSDRINKKALGEFLGEGDPENIAIMHAFIDLLDFEKTRFVDALRKFLQTFRLPGEAQKIDRLMLKFAERYTGGNPNAFANADTAYVLAYSVIMLNTDQHSSNVKSRMTVEDFIKNNRGINDNENLPDEYLQGIFDEIAHNEIVLDTERENAANLGLLPQPSGGFASGLGQALATVGRDLQREAYNQASEEMANKTEQLFKDLLRAQRKSAGKSSSSRFVEAQSFKHIGPMFEVTWMSYLTSLSGQVQETNNTEAIKSCMEGLKLAIRIACLFDLPDPRQAFTSSLARFTNLYNLSEMKVKNVEALRMLLDVAYAEGNLLKESWRDVLTSISQLDRFQLISTGVKEGDVPDVGRRQRSSTPAGGRRPNQPPRLRQRTESGFHANVAEETRSADMIRNVDRIFTNTANLSGDAIVHFVRALTQVSWQEIQSSGSSESPRTYSLQKIVEVSGYNMTRVRFEWTTIWQVLGEHFVQVGCHNNTSVVYFALNSLRQLSMRFMEIEELPGFKFQKDFLKPFEHILSNANQVPVKDMVLRCLIQMIQARGDNIRSGWRTMFGVFAVAAKEPYESIVNLAFDNVTQVYNDRFGIVISQGAFADLVVCLTDFSKNGKFQKKSLQAIETLKVIVPKMLRTPECPLSHKSDITHAQEETAGKHVSRQTQEEQFWFPVLFAFHDVLMTGEDLEVRSRALNYLFDTLSRYGQDFPSEFWDILWRQLLYPIFMVLKSKSEMSKALNHEELSVWLSTTMIQALRNMITLFTHFFDSLEYMLDRFLDLLTLCICQENDTLARIGSNCLQQLILQNVTRFTPAHWEQIVGAFVELFSRTEATALFSAATSSHYRRPSAASLNGSIESNHDQESIKLVESKPVNGSAEDQHLQPEQANGHHTEPSSAASPRPSTTLDGSVADEDKELESFHPPPNTQTAPVIVTAARRRFFNQIITKCVLQLLMIETVSELFTNDLVYSSIPSTALLHLMALLKKSYHFAKRFNADRDLRTRLFREGFMRQPPNLLKQESGSASVYVAILLRMYADSGPERAASRAETEAALIPLCADIVSSFVALDDDTQHRNMLVWRPVVVDVLEGYTAFADQDFKRHLPTFAPLAVGLMGKEMGLEMQRALQALWARVVEVGLGFDKVDQGVLMDLDAARRRGSLTSANGGRRKS